MSSKELLSTIHDEECNFVDWSEHCDYKMYFCFTTNTFIMIENAIGL
jgi:hypothetical protein